MMDLGRVKWALESLVQGDTSTEQREAVRAAIESGQLTLATGERAIAVGGDANGAAFVTGDGNLLLAVNASTAEAVKEAIASLFRPSPNQLPADLADFQGREEQVEKLKAILITGAMGSVSAIGGMGGVGKSALALHVAHQLAEAAPDGRIFVDMGGTSEQPLTPVAAMTRVIQTLQPAAQVPPELEPAQSLYRSCLDGKRVLLLLDNAENTAQVAPLIEWRAPTTLLIVTARYVIAGLENLQLDVMAPGEARDLLRVVLGDRAGGDDDLDALAERCGRLPLALRVAGTFLTVYRDWTISEYLKALADERQRLSLLRIEDDVRLDVQAVLGLSARKLDADNPMLAMRWRMLAVFPQSFDRAAAAALWEASEANTRRSLSELVRRSMVLYDEADGRYHLHDLMRHVARLSLAVEDGAAALARLEAAGARHAKHYYKVLATADGLYQKGGRDVLAGRALYDLEQRNIAAGQAWAAERIDSSDDAARLAADLSRAGAYVLELRLHPRTRIGWFEAQLIACRRLGDRRREGQALGNLGIAHNDLGEPSPAIKFHEERLAIAREIGDRRGEGAALGNLGSVCLKVSQPQRAITSYEWSLAIAREIGDRQCECTAIGGLGAALAVLGEPRRAIEHFEQQLAIAREIGDRLREGYAMFNSARALDQLGERGEAIERMKEALRSWQETGAERLAEEARAKLAEWSEDSG